MSLDLGLGLAERAQEITAGWRRGGDTDWWADARRQNQPHVDAALEAASCAYERDALTAGAVPAVIPDHLWFGGVRGAIARHDMVRQYAWAIPSAEALDAIAELSPIVEVGAGGGYWSMLLRERGARVAPFDLQPYPLLNGYARRAWTPVSRGGPARALKGERAGWTLLLCWPSYLDDWSERALALHRGEWVAYVGEGQGGCTATDAFHDRLERDYRREHTVRLPQWEGIHDWLELWKRRLT